MEDEQIVALYWQRDTAALTATAKKYGSFCQRLAQSVLDVREDAEECVNDTWHRAWDTIPPQRPQSLRAYLGRIVKNLAIDRYRRERSRKRFHGLDVSLTELEECLPGGGGPEEQTEQKLLAERINCFLASLPREKRVMFLRRYWYGQTVTEIARDFGRSKSAVSAALAALRRQLRDCLTEEGILESE